MNTLGFNFQGWSGWEAFYALLPEQWQAKIVARKLLRGPYKTLDPGKTPFVIRMIARSYRIADTEGNVEPCAGEFPPQLF